MDSNGFLRIEKRPLQHWLLLWILFLPFLWGAVFQLLSLPSIVKYTADVAWIVLLGLMLSPKVIKVEKKIQPLVLMVVMFFLYCLFLYLTNYQSIIYFLWGMRNNFRYYVFFFAIVLYFQEADIGKILDFIDWLFWINIPIVFVQYFLLGYEQDFLGGILGVEAGVNAVMIIFFTIVLSRSLLKYMEQKEPTWLCGTKCAVALFIAALAELKFFFILFVIILIMAAFFTTFSWRKVLFFAFCAALVSLASMLLVTLFGFENFLSIENIWEAATQEHYSTEATVNRLSAIPTLAATVITDAKDRFLGFGLGNCDTSAFAICNTPFYRMYGHLRYTFFSIAFLFLEVGYIGIALYISFFVICFVLIRRRLREGKCNTEHGRIALVMAVLAIILVFYNASLRAEGGYIVYFILATPFLDSAQNVPDEGTITS